MKNILATMTALALTIAAQAQQNDGLDDIMAEMIAAKVHQECIDTANLVARLPPPLRRHQVHLPFGCKGEVSKNAGALARNSGGRGRPRSQANSG